MTQLKAMLWIRFHHLYVVCTSSPFNSSPSGAQPRRKTEVIAELSDSLRDVGIAKKNRKRLYNAGVQATQQKENEEKETTRDSHYVWSRKNAHSSQS